MYKAVLRETGENVAVKVRGRNGQQGLGFPGPDPLLLPRPSAWWRQWELALVGLNAFTFLRC